MVKRRGGEERKGESWGGGGKFSLVLVYFFLIFFLKSEQSKPGETQGEGGRLLRRADMRGEWRRRSSWLVCSLWYCIDMLSKDPPHIFELE